MRTLLSFLAGVTLSMYVIVAFISYLPNPGDWGNGGRGAFTFFTLVISFVGAAIHDSVNDHKK